MRRVSGFILGLFVTAAILYSVYFGRQQTQRKKRDQLLDIDQFTAYTKTIPQTLLPNDAYESRNMTDPNANILMFEKKFKGSLFPGRMQLFQKTIVHLTNARHNRTMWNQLDLMALPPHTFNKEFRNPCWWSRKMPEGLCMRSPRLAPATHRIYSHNNTYRLPHLRCLPYFYIIGQGKSGTTDLFRKLIQHPNVSSMIKKETQWLCRLRLQSRKSCISIESYTSMFQEGADYILQHHTPRSFNPYVTGEATPGYFSNNDFWDLLPGNEETSEPRITNADLIHHVTPGAKIIILLRNPTERLYSYYFHKHGIFNKPTSREHFHHLVLREIRKFEICLKIQSVRGCAYNYNVSDSLTEPLDLRRGIYHVFLSDWMKVFPRHQIHVIKFEDYIVNRRNHLASLFRFLELSGREHRSPRIFIKLQITGLHTDGKGRRYLGYVGDVSKTNPDGINQRKVKGVRAYGNLDRPELCYVRLYEKYLSLCPKTCSDSSRDTFCPTPLKKRHESQWFFSMPFGHNTLQDTVLLVEFQGIRRTILFVRQRRHVFTRQTWMNKLSASRLGVGVILSPFTREQAMIKRRLSPKL